MAHELAKTNHKPAMAYFGPTPWHGLGTKLDNPATAHEAITAAGLDFGVELAAITTHDQIPVPHRKAVIRTDSNQVLGVVGNGYAPVQNHQCFSFLDAVVADGTLRYHTAGALGKGERVWMLAKLPGHIRVHGTDDVTEKFLLLSNSHDGTSSLRVLFTPIRVVCANTLTIAHQLGHDQGISIYHRGNLAAKVRQAQVVLGLATKFYDDVESRINQLASYQPTPAQITSYFRNLYPDPEHGDQTRAANTRDHLLRLFETGRGQDIPGVRHSAWAAFNAVTEFVDHYRPTRSQTPAGRADLRLRSQWFGTGARLKAKSWGAALALVNQN